MQTHFTYDTVVQGQPLRTVTHHLTPELVREFCAATGDAEDWLQRGMAPPALAGVLGMATFGHPGVDRPDGDVHVEQEYRHVAPLAVGSHVTTWAYVMEKYVRKGRRYLVFETHSVDGSGRLLVAGRTTIAVPR